MSIKTPPAILQYGLYSCLVSDIAVFVLKRDAELQPASPIKLSIFRVLF